MSTPHHSTLRSLACRLADAATLPHWPAFTSFPPEGTPEGFAFHIVTKGYRRPVPPWFAHSRFAREHREHAPDVSLGIYRVSVLIDTPTLLRQALFNQGKLHQSLALSLLWLLEPTIASFDGTLAADLRLFQKNYAVKDDAYREAYPLDFGQPDTAAEERFNRHLERLLSSKATVKTLRNVLNAFFGSGTPRNTPGLTAEDRQRVFLIAPDHLRSAVSVEQHSAQAKWRWYMDVMCALAGNDPKDGAVRVLDGRREYVLIHWAEFAKIAAAQQRDTGTSTHHVDEAPDYLKGARMRRAFEDAVNTYPSVLQDVKSLPGLVRQQGWVWDDSIDSPYGIYLANALEAVATKCDRRARLGYDARKFDKPRGGERKRRIIAEEYSFNDDVYPIDVIQVRLRLKDGSKIHRNYFTLPYDEVAVYDKPLVGRNYVQKFGFRRFFTLRGVNAMYNAVRHIAEKQGISFEHDKVTARWLQFRDWVELKDISFTPERFAKRFKDSQIGERIQAKNRGDRRGVGAYTDEEDRELREFCEARSTGKLSPTEVALLSSRYSYRSLGSVRNRITELGFDYALVHGWTAYCNSGYCFVRSAARRKEWKKKGVRP